MAALMTQAEMESWLDKGWTWLADPANARNPKYVQIEDAWLKKLGEYEQTCRLATAVPHRTGNG